MSSGPSSLPSSIANHSISKFYPQTTHEFDVFISFTGKTRYGFTSHLIKELRRVGLTIFTDDQLPRGEAISDGLIHHIKRSRSTIVVSSKDFAASPSCLDELMESFRCKEDGEHPIFPIFYKLHPSELRRLNGRTAHYLSLHDHSLGNNSDRVAWWKTCLVLLSDMAGWHFNNWSGNESEFIERIAHQVNTTLKMKKAAVINNKGYHGAKADLWSCGVILFVLMAGYLPFEEANLMALYKKIFKADFTCPPWFSSSAKKLIKRILDPSPDTRITIAEVIENDWFKKVYKPPVFQQAEVNLDDINAIFNESGNIQNLVVERREEGPRSTAPVTMNAFELISTSQGLNLSSLFEKQMGLVKQETRFTSKCPANDIISKIEQAAGPLGFDVKKNDFKMKLLGEKTGRKGHLAVSTEIFEVAPSLYMVELRKSGGDTLEFHKFYKDISTGLKDIVWKSDDVIEEESNGIVGGAHS